MSNFVPVDLDVLFIDDDPEFCRVTAQHFQSHGCRVETAFSGEAALRLLSRRAFDVIVLDLVMPGISGLDLLRKFKVEGMDGEVVVLTGEGTIPSAVEAMKLGTYDYLTKPLRLSALEAIIQKAAEAGRLRRENSHLRAALARQKPSHLMIGQSLAMQEVFQLIERAGPTDKPILIQGESGTGKELVARALHAASPLAANPLVVINCTALPETLLESELFGHEKGAFTGAVSSKQGLFEVADGATLLIDEIGEMSGALQVKLLRVLEDGSMRRVGSLKERRVKVRILAATNRDMAAEVKAGRFREDLYYRINVMTLVVPPLRERHGDILLLLEHFLGSQWTIEPGALKFLGQYPWPGNVRQLMNALERAKIMADDHTICLANLPPEIRNYSSILQGNSFIDSETDLASIKKSHIVDVLQREQGNKARTAKALGVSRRTLYRLLEKYAIESE